MTQMNQISYALTNTHKWYIGRTYSVWSWLIVSASSFCAVSKYSTGWSLAPWVFIISVCPMRLLWNGHPLIMLCTTQHDVLHAVAQRAMHVVHGRILPNKWLKQSHTNEYKSATIIYSILFYIIHIPPANASLVKISIGEAIILGITLTYRAFFSDQ